MTFKINKSFLDFAKDRGVIIDFPGGVTKHCAELNSWRTREDEVDAQPPLLPKPEWGDFVKENDPAAAWQEAWRKWNAYRLEYKERFPRPSAIPDIELSVRYDDGAKAFIEDYEIVDDGPTPEQVLAAKKAELYSKIADAEVKAREAVTLTPGKQRMASFMMGLISKTDQAFLKKLEDDVAPEDLAAANIDRLVEVNRTDEQKSFLAGVADREAKLAKIDETATLALAAVDDLTADNIDSFVLPVFET